MAEWFDTAGAIPELRGTTIHVAPAGREGEIRRRLEAAGFSVRVLQGRGVFDEASFFREVAKALRPPSTFGHNWDALGDILGDLADGPSRRVALLWREAERSLGRDVQTVVAALLAFSRAADDLAGEDPPTQLEVFVLGEGAAFGSPAARGR
jgi:RNAse (barnase) inhibitor barstar